MKICSKCKQTKDLSRAEARDRWLRNSYWIGHEKYLEILAGQLGECAICHLHIDEYENDHFDVDHDHETGAVRGLLCTSCNRMLDRWPEREAHAAYMEALNG
jgi:hypothetical protein